jgi:hypothetical protein
VGATHRLKLRVGARKDADAEMVTGGLILPEEQKIEEIWVELSLEPIFSPIQKSSRPKSVFPQFL